MKICGAHPTRRWLPTDAHTNLLLFVSPTVVDKPLRIRHRLHRLHTTDRVVWAQSLKAQANDEQDPLLQQTEVLSTSNTKLAANMSPLLLKPLNVVDSLPTGSPSSAVRPAVEVSAELRKIILRLYGQHLSEDGRKVNYKALARDPQFQTYVESTAELQRVKVGPDHMNREESLCFWINTYNALVVHATVVAGPPQNTFQRLKFFGNASYQIDGERFSLDDIEHGILRGNAPKPTNLFSILGLSFLAPKTFSEADPRNRLAISPVDPRIHFALNCGATSCPPIRVYTPDRLEFGLKAAASSFCAFEVSVEQDTSTIVMSSILKWYGKDFGSKADLIEFLRHHVTEETKSRLENVILRVGSDVQRIKFKYMPYDWGVNEAE
jgi:hypothetical protein